MKSVAAPERHDPSDATAEKGDAWRDALFERLAVQTGMVPMDEIVQARVEQSLSPASVLADVLVRRQVLSPQARKSLEVLVEEQSRRNGTTSGLLSGDTSREGPPNGQSAKPGETLTLEGPRENWRPEARQFAGYELLSEIARGGMGVVYRARQVKLGRMVALKMILSGEFSGEDQVRRFYSEAEAAAKLDHPNIVPVYEVGEASGQHFYSMALIEGQSLHELVKKEGPLPPRRAAQLLRSVAQAVAYAHEKGIVHRDLKPHNILLELGDQPKVTDFGLAKQVGSISDLTLTGQVIGTPSYMPPEQALGKGSSVGPLADVYALGATLYFLLAGHAPFHGSSPAEIIRLVIESEPVPLRRLNPSIPRDLETICLKCLRKEPENRYESAAAVALDLRRWLANEPIVARPVRPWERAWLWCRRRPALATFLAAGLVCLIVGSLVVRDRLQTTRATGLVDAALSAESRDLETLRPELRRFRAWADPLLHQRLADETADTKAKLHASLCLVENDSRQCDYLLDRLAAATPEEAALIGRALLPYQEQVNERLWRSMDKPPDRRSRLPLASALAIVAPTGDGWRKCSGEIASLLVTLPPFEAGPWIKSLQPAGKILAVDLERIYRNEVSAESSERTMAASALGEYRADDSAKLLDLLLLAKNAADFQPLLAALRPHRATACAELRRVLQEPVPAVEIQLTRDVLWKPHEARDLVWRRQACAAVALVNLQDGEPVWEILKRSSDPTLRSYVIERFHTLGTPYALLRERLEKEEDAGATASILLSMGTFESLDFAAADLAQLTQDLLEIYRSSPDGGVHAAAEWTLRRWKQGESIVAAIPVASGSALSGKGSWLIDSRGETFVRVAGPATFTMFEKTNQTVPTKVTLDYPFAVAAREVTLHQFRQFDLELPYDATYAPTLDCPVHSMFFSWQNAAAYCNWLSEKAGLPREEWAYEGERASGLVLAANYVSRSGYRLPTEAEWEYVCKAGTTTMFSSGDTVEALGGYGWHLDNAAARCWPGGTKMPNDLGAFDMHGNVMEWCHRQSADSQGKLTVTFGSAVNTATLRSGSFTLGPMGVRSDWRRTLSPPQEFYHCMGFRVARSLPEK